MAGPTLDMAGPTLDMAGPTLDMAGPTLASSLAEGASVARKRLETALAPFAARVAKLRDGALACVLTSAARTDQARQAVRCALALRREHPDLPVVVASGRAQLTGLLPVGEAIDRASRLLMAAVAPELPREAVRLDDLTAGMLGAGFALGGDAESLAVLAEQQTEDAPPPLLGRKTPCVGRDKEIAYL
jgi:hypothetical protein